MTCCGGFDVKGLIEDSSTKKKSISYWSTDGMYVFVAVDPRGAVDVSVGGDDLTELGIQLSRAEAIELANFILRGL